MSENLPGDDETSIVDLAVDYAKTERTARGEHRGENVRIKTYCEGESWHVKAQTRTGGAYFTNEYPSRGDAYRAFEWLCEEHDLEEQE